MIKHANPQCEINFLLACMATLKSPAAKFRRSRFYFALCGRKMIWAVTMAFFTTLALIFE